MNIRELQNLIDEYLETRDDQDDDEFYNTPRGFAEKELELFMDWIKARPTPDVADGANTLPDSIKEALNNGDGSYHP